jgi:syntaxin 16
MYKLVEMKKTNPKLNDSGGKLLNDGNNKYNLLNNSSKGEASVVMSSGGNSAPDFVDIFDKTNRTFTEIAAKFTRLQEEQQKRIMPRFNEDENVKINKVINSIANDITKNLTMCEGNIKQLNSITCSSNAENSMKNNMKMNLTGKMKDLTMKISRNEENYLVKYKDLGLDESSRMTHSEKSKNDFLEMSMSDNILKKRDVEINDLVRSINDLAHIFKEISNLVNEQGTILDRIDYNIENAITNTVKANVHLKKTEEIQEKSNCVRNGIMALIAVNFILGFMLLMKFA